MGLVRPPLLKYTGLRIFGSMEVERSESIVESASSDAREPLSGQMHCEGKAWGGSYVGDLVTKTLSIMENGLKPNARGAAEDSIPVTTALEDCLKELSEVFSDADEETQSELVSEVLSSPKNLQTYYRFADHLYKGVFKFC